MLRDGPAAGDAEASIYSGGTSLHQVTIADAALTNWRSNPAGQATVVTNNVSYIRGSDLGGGVGGTLYTITRPTVSITTPLYQQYNGRGDVTGYTNTPAQIAGQLARNTDFRLVSSLGRSNINLVGGRYVVGGVESSGYLARTVTHHEMMHMAQFIRNPTINTSGLGAMRHEILPSFVGTPEIYGGVSMLIGGGVYLGIRE